MPPKKKASTGHPTRATRSSARLALQGASGSVESKTTECDQSASGSTSPQECGNPGTEYAEDQSHREEKAPVQKAFRMRRGTLQQLPEMPIEIQDMIFHDLGPQDLLNLSRTCKRVRSHFLSRENERLWKAAIENAPEGLPAQPPWLSAPAFVHLLYSQFCHNCGTSNIRKVQFGTFIRLCSTCIQERTVWFKEPFASVDDLERQTWPCTSLSLAELEKMMPVLEQTENARSPKKNRLLKESVALLIEAFRESVKKKERYQYFKEACETIRRDYAARLPYAKALNRWLHEQEYDRKSELDVARQKRFDLIISRLRANGWDKELEYLGEYGVNEMFKLPIVRQSSKLTDGAWNKVLAVLDPFLVSIREERLNAQIKAALKSRMKVLREAIASHCTGVPRTVAMDCRPQEIDLAFVPECRAILDLPTTEIVTAADFASVMPQVITQWEAEQRAVLTEYLRPHLGDIADDVDPLALAIAMFSHKGRSEDIALCALRHPTVFLHYCQCSQFRERRTTKAELDQADLFTRMVMTLYWRDIQHAPFGGDDAMWMQVQIPFRLAERLAPRSKAGVPVARMREIVVALGLDPTRATIDDLRACEGALWCATCEEARPDSAIFACSWNAAYVHATMCHPEGQSGWRLADEGDMAKVRAYRESLKDSRRSLDHGPSWSCTLCPTFIGSDYTMPMHLAKEHNIQDHKQAICDKVIYPFPRGDGLGRMSLGDTVLLREDINTTGP
ncbi:hypothetical protein C8Q78DRAFT_1056442 [Trametes maxima]|nr:hypothetical protein C8Q78DRAFT_1056442 [Trametes maxima]